MSSSVGGGGGGGAALAGGDVAGLLDKAKELDQLRKEQDDVATEINKIHKKIISSPEMVDKSVDAMMARLRGFYVQARELSESEVSASSALVGLLDGLLQSGVSAAPRKKIEISEQKKKRMKSDTDTTRFSSASMRSQLDQAANLKGEQVAARVKSDDEKDEWFVVKVIHFDKETKEYKNRIVIGTDTPLRTKPVSAACGCHLTFREGVGGYPSSRLVVYRGKPLAAASSSS
uniref:SGF29 C-terminal domain-containing protein n=1 Tax=Triticum urartu TaxID=4572 RepID=A0A8R7UDV3_TRIUA